MMVLLAPCTTTHHTLISRKSCTCPHISYGNFCPKMQQLFLFICPFIQNITSSVNINNQKKSSYSNPFTIFCKWSMHKMMHVCMLRKLYEPMNILQQFLSVKLFLQKLLCLKTRPTIFDDHIRELEF